MSGPVDPRLLREVRAARTAVAAAVVLGLLTTGLVLAQAALLARLLAGALTGRPAAGRDLALLAAVVLLRAGTAWCSALVQVRCSARVKTALRARLLAHALALGPGWLAGERRGELATLATRGLDALDGWFGRYLPQLVLGVLVPVAVLARLVTVDLLSAVVVGLTVPLVPLFMALVGLHTRARTERSWRLLEQLGGHFLDTVRGLPTLRLFGRARAQAEAVRRVTDDHRRATMEVLQVAFLSALVLELLATLSVALVAVEIGLRLVHGGIAYETALLVLLLAPEAYLPLRRVGAEFHACQEGAVAAERVFAVLDTPLPVAGTTALAGTGPVGLRLRDVSVALPGRPAPVLDHVDLAVAPGERVAVVGPSGSGKSTLLAVLERFRDVDAGEVLVDGVPLAELDPDRWRDGTAWLAQSPYLRGGSVADEVRLGAPDADDAAVGRALQAAGLGLAATTPVGEQGVLLSAGQRRRVALARALLRVERGARLLLLDEPTEALDAATAQDVRAALAAMPRSVTVVVVTHDPGTAALADRVVRLSDGRVVPAAEPDRVAA